MKKIMTSLLAVMMMVMLTACGSNTGSANLEGTTAEIIDEIYAVKDSGLNVQTIEVDLEDSNSVKAYTGLDSADQITEASVSESMMGSQAYSVVVVRVDDADNAQDVAEEMKAGIDQRKWICVEADDLSVAGYGDVVLLVMVGTDLSDTVTSAELVDAFEEVCGGSLSFTL